MKNTLFAIGESLIDFIPSESGVAFDEIEAFYPKVGGAPANVLGAFAKLGGKTQMLTQLGYDPFGHKILNALKNWNIGTDYIKLTDEANTALAFVSLLPDGNREFSFYRNPSADMLYDCSQIEDKWFDDCYGLLFCSVSLGDTPMKQTHRKAIDLTHEREDEIFEKLGYIDIQNLAKRMKAELLMFTGLMDTICPPSTQFAMYNKVKSKKDVVFYPEYGHENLRYSGDKIFEFLSDL